MNCQHNQLGAGICQICQQQNYYNNQTYAISAAGGGSSGGYNNSFNWNNLFKMNCQHNQLGAGICNACQQQNINALQQQNINALKNAINNAINIKLQKTESEIQLELIKFINDNMEICQAIRDGKFNDYGYLNTSISKFMLMDVDDIKHKFYKLIYAKPESKDYLKNLINMLVLK